MLKATSAIPHRSDSGCVSHTQTLQGMGTNEQTITGRVVEAVAEATGREATDLEPLGHVLDPEALDTLFSRREHACGRVSFRYAGCDVVVEAPDDVQVTPRT